ncbi:transglutaminase-like domain-containing protein [Pseudozobellia thermophila]|uniref:Transglutaminase-like enzyme, putative cysteine protease n=1 Tax=Pseudozobellia thermophila TaxID=192903 RepID=A0A1M6LBF1_9FLAO|nr:transglutaminase family protein [Pseudozobellia thermophila]SHJ68489.1 Transglutaminase-like enzyme, putative cysteine protease [Pseudozobellia thermophila]
MSLEYFITYKAENTYEEWVHEAYWQFLVVPEENDSQQFIGVDFNNSINARHEFSINGYGFKTIRVHPKDRFKEITFEANFKLIKKKINPFDFKPEVDRVKSYAKIQELDFKVDFDAHLKTTVFTSVPNEKKGLFEFDKDKSIFDNLLALNQFTYKHIQFDAHATDVHTTLKEVLEIRKGVCQDFTHLFCALARANGIPARYVSGYLHQGNGYFGDSQMHAWAEAYVPYVGWIGFDPTNDILADTNHIKVAHGKDYVDCSPLKGIVYTAGKNKTVHSVQVNGQNQQ